MNEGDPIITPSCVPCGGGGWKYGGEAESAGGGYGKESIGGSSYLEIIGFWSSTYCIDVSDGDIILVKLSSSRSGRVYSWQEKPGKAGLEYTVKPWMR